MDQLLKSLERAHFAAVQDELARETLTYTQEDYIERGWTFADQLAEPAAGGWVN